MPSSLFSCPAFLTRRRWYQVETANWSQQEPDINSRVVTVTRKEASNILGLSESTLDALTKAGKLGHCRTGRRVYYLERHIEEFLASAEEAAKAALDENAKQR